MKKLLTTFLSLSSLLFLSFTPAHSDGGMEGDPIKYEVVAHGSLHDKANHNTDCFSLDSQFDYDDFWMAQYGTLLNKPSVDMTNCRLLVLLKAGTIDNITVSSESINIYLTTTNYVHDDMLRAPAFCLIKIDYNGKPIRVFQQFAQPQ